MRGRDEDQRQTAVTGGVRTSLDTWEVASHTFTIRIRKCDERAPVLPHNYFVVEAAAVGSEGWRELLAWRGDEGAPIRREQVHIVNDRIACAFAGTKLTS